MTEGIDDSSREGPRFQGKPVSLPGEELRNLDRIAGNLRLPFSSFAPAPGYGRARAA